MSKVKILVVEDEIIIADNICDTLNDLGYETLEPAVNYTEALVLIESENPDIAILDIQLSGHKTGIDIANSINERYNFPFIFLTSNSDEATVSEAKKAQPNAFLVKPFTKEELFTSIEIALYNYAQKMGSLNDTDLVIKDALFVKDKGFFDKIDFKDILYLKAAHVYVEIFQKEGKHHIVRCSLNDIIHKMNSKFIRVHRGFIVNTAYIQQINDVSLKINQAIIPIGKTYRNALLKRINFI